MVRLPSANTMYGSPDFKAASIACGRFNAQLVSKPPVLACALKLVTTPPGVMTIQQDESLRDLPVCKAMGASIVQIDEYRAKLAQLSGLKAEDAAASAAAAEAQRNLTSLTDAAKRTNEEFRTPLKVLTDRYKELNNQLATGALGMEANRRAVEAAQDTFTKATEPIEDGQGHGLRLPSGPRRTSRTA